ncbi:MAG: dihydrolipoyl dehydrogenase family protein [Thermoprotei archaeon]
MKYDVAIIGGGTAGYAAGVALSRKGKKVVVIERDRIGGTCVNYGCVPAIFLFDIAFLYSRFVEIANYKGLDGEVDLNSFFSKLNEIINYLNEAGKKLITSSGGDVIFGEAEIISRRSVRVNDEVIEADIVVIATGTSPKMPEVEGADEAISEDDATRLNFVPPSMVVIGGGIGAVELAQIYARLGSSVTLVSRSKVLKFLSEEARKTLLESMEFDGVKVVENAKIERIKSTAVVTDKGVFEGEVVVYATGRIPNIPKGAEAIGLNFSDQGILVNSRLETNVPGIYAIGDVVGRPLKLAHLAYLDALVLTTNLTGGREEVNYRGVPAVIYADPMVGFAGDMNEATQFVKFPLSANTRAIIKGLREGFVLLGLNDEGTIVYAEIVGDTAEELISVASLAIRAGMKVKDLAFSPFPHPSLSEAIVNAARAYFGLDVDTFK